MFVVNPILACDFYKIGHKFQYPEGTEKVYSNLTARSNKNGSFANKIVVSHIQSFILQFLVKSFNSNFFNLPKELVIAEYDRRNNLSLGGVDSTHIAELHDLGYLPLEIKALPEGTRASMKVPVLTVTNTHPKFAWLVNYIETALSAEVWKGIVSSTIAFEYKKVLTKYAIETGSPLDFVLWQGHDFSMRGMSGVNDAASTGAGHLFSFLGTDTIPAIQFVEWYYGGLNTFVGGSVPATEHSVMCAGGMENEVETIRRIIQDVYPSGVVSVVSDTWDFWDTITNKAKTLKDVIMNRKPDALGLAKTVFRPDSGNPVAVICGYKIADLDANPDLATDFYNLRDYEVIKTNGKYYHFEMLESSYYDAWEYTGYELLNEISEAEAVGAVETLWNIFGGTVTDKGYKMLDSHVGLIYGDSITLDRAKDILQGLKSKGFASGNIVFGIGSFTYQYQTRDTFGIAMKATYVEINGEPVEIFKNPKTDNGTKKSAKGLLKVEKVNGEYVLFDQVSSEEEKKGELRTVFIDGVLTVRENIDTIRARINEEIQKELKLW